ncbi:MAG TPA: hypothetical protein VMU43_09980 [Candidatus Acidoferrum sp.]|nr:hypothetical protein [Candidatus Acidoferrum sp.]
MNTDSADRKQPETPEDEAKGTRKKPYEKPTVRHERVFETMALSCGKVQSTQGSCHFNRRAS